MVRIEQPGDYERLDAVVRAAVERGGHRLDVTGWSRKTYDVYARTRPGEPRRALLRVESFATTSGEITVFDDAAMPLAEELGTALEREFGVAEAVVVRRPAPD